MFTKVVKCKPDMSGQFYEKRLSVSERNMKLLVQTVTIQSYKIVACIITVETNWDSLHARLNSYYEAWKLLTA